MVTWRPFLAFLSAKNISVIVKNTNSYADQLKTKLESFKWFPLTANSPVQMFQLPTSSLHHTSLWKKGEDYNFSQTLCVRIKDNNNLPHGKFHRFSFPFSRKFLGLYFTSYVFCTYPCYVTWHTVGMGYLWHHGGSTGLHCSNANTLLKKTPL